MNRALPLIREGIVPHRCRHGMVIALVAGMLAGPAYVCAETVYVQAKTAQLRSGKTSLDSVVANVKYGEALDVVRRDGNWIEVKTVRGSQRMDLFEQNIQLETIRKQRYIGPIRTKHEERGCLCHHRISRSKGVG